MNGDVAEAIGRDVPRETLDRLKAYAALLAEESLRQNLISAATVDDLWSRHILDSAQLLSLAGGKEGDTWVDIGSGAGLPGLVIAILSPDPMTLVEPRRLRAEFLSMAADSLGLANRVRVFAGRAERLTGSYGIITARAVAPLPSLLKMSTHLSTRKTLWLLPKGRNAERELAEARRNWHCEAEVVPSRTDSDAGILVLRSVRAKGKR